MTKFRKLPALLGASPPLKSSEAIKTTIERCSSFVTRGYRFVLNTTLSCMWIGRLKNLKGSFNNNFSFISPQPPPPMSEFLSFAFPPPTPTPHPLPLLYQFHTAFFFVYIFFSSDSPLKRMSCIVQSPLSLLTPLTQGHSCMTVNESMWHQQTQTVHIKSI